MKEKEEAEAEEYHLIIMDQSGKEQIAELTLNAEEMSALVGLGLRTMLMRYIKELEETKEGTA
jgi:hypothetical protein